MVSSNVIYMKTGGMELDTVKRTENMDIRKAYNKLNWSNWLLALLSNIQHWTVFDESKHLEKYWTICIQNNSVPICSAFWDSDLICDYVTMKLTFYKNVFEPVHIFRTLN